MTGELRVLDRNGDTKIIWDSENADEVDAARETFERLKKKGYVAYSVNKKGDKGELVRAFNPLMERLILAPQLEGG